MAHFKVVVSGDTLEQYVYKNGSTASKRTPPDYDHVPDNKDKPDTRFQSSISRSRLNIRRLISCNQNAWGADPLFITFTFADNITDLSTANPLWKRFVRSYSYSLGYRLKYLTVVEFQKRGAVHYHSIFFNVKQESQSLSPIQGKAKGTITEKINTSRTNALNYHRDAFKEELIRHWSHGFVDVKKITKVQSVGGYIAKYLQKDVMDKRLLGEKVYFTSRGLIKPKILASYERLVKSYPHDHVDHELLGSYILQREKEESYNTHFQGPVIYSRFKIISQTHVENRF